MTAPIPTMPTDQRPIRSAAARLRLTGGSAGASVPAAPAEPAPEPPAPTSSRSGTATGVRATRPNAYSATNPTVASA